MPRSAATCSGIAPSPIRWAAPARVVALSFAGRPVGSPRACLAARAPAVRGGRAAGSGRQLAERAGHRADIAWRSLL